MRLRIVRPLDVEAGVGHEPLHRIHGLVVDVTDIALENDVPVLQYLENVSPMRGPRHESSAGPQESERFTGHASGVVRVQVLEEVGGEDDVVRFPVEAGIPRVGAKKGDVLPGIVRESSLAEVDRFLTEVDAHDGPHPIRQCEVEGAPATAEIHHPVLGKERMDFEDLPHSVLLERTLVIDEV